MSANFIEDYCRLHRAFSPPAVYLVPTTEHAQRIKALVMEKINPLINPQVFSFNEYVLQKIKTRPITELQKQVLVRRVARAIPCWQNVVQYPVVVEALTRAIAECKQYLLAPEKIMNQNFSAVYRAYEALDFFDQEDALEEYVCEKDERQRAFPEAIFLDGFDEVTPLQQRIVDQWKKAATVYAPAPVETGFNPVSTGAGITVLTGDTRIAEIEHVAQEILKTKKDSNIPWSEIALIFRQIGDYKYIIADVFRRYGIPVTIHEGVYLKDNPVIQGQTVSLETGDLDQLEQDSQWPELRTYARESIRCVERWKEIEKELSEVGGAADHDLALTQVMVSIKERPANQVQVYDALIARQKEYKVVFVCNCVLGSWPAVISPGLILSDEERAFLGLKTVADRVKNESRLWQQTLGIATEKLYVTYPERGVDGVRLSPSHFLNGLAIAERRAHVLTILPALDDRPAPYYDSAAIRAFHEAALTELQAMRTFRVTAIEQYTQCGFQFFCRTLLKCIEKDDDQYYRNRGILIHQVLQKALAGEDVTLALVKPQSLAQQIGFFIEEEKKRLKNISRKVMATEESVVAKINGITLTGKIDRRDEGPEGGVLVDYKTGEIPKAGLQLLIYALMVKNVTSVEYLQVLKNKIKSLPITLEINNQTEKQLQNIFREIYRGNFYQYEHGCRSCAYTYACRMKQ
jgi:ATP-dependent helicase/DNAse subunit B